MKISTARSSAMKRPDDPDKRFEWDVTAGLVLAAVIMFIERIVVSLWLQR